jgi:tellurite resistance protein
MVFRGDDDTMRRYLGALVAIARADGTLDARERSWILHVGVARWGAELDDDALGQAAQAHLDDGPAITGDLALALLDDAVVLAIIDGPVNDAEITALVELARASGVEPWHVTGVR